MPDTLCIEELALKTTIGIHPWEQHVQQTVLISLEFPLDVAKIAASDAIEHTVDYDSLVHELTAFLAQKRFNLLETLAETVAKQLLERYRWSELRLTAVKTGAIKMAKTVSVNIVRKISDYTFA